MLIQSNGNCNVEVARADCGSSTVNGGSSSTKCDVAIGIGASNGSTAAGDEDAVTIKMEIKGLWKIEFVYDEHKKLVLKVLLLWS